MELRVVVFPVHGAIWKVVDSAHPQASIGYVERDDAIDCARGLATENAPSLVEVLTSDGRIALRERYVRTIEGFVRVEFAAIETGDSLRPTAWSETRSLRGG
jgi:hypothetical protein